MPKPGAAPDCLQYHADVFTDMGDVLARKPELIFVHAPTTAHPEIVAACLAAKAAVYVDKPLAYHLADREALASRAAAEGPLLAVCFNRRFAPLHVRARDWVTTDGNLRLGTMEKASSGRPASVRILAMRVPGRIEGAKQLKRRW